MTSLPRFSRSSERSSSCFHFPAITAIILCVLLVHPRLDAAPDLVINEFLADNENGLINGDGNRSDWIEIRNIGDEAADLALWHLTDDSSQPFKWQFPARMLEPGEYLLIFASGRVEDDYIDPDGHPHTNFRLDAAGEYLALVRPDGSIAQQFSPAFPPQRSDVSFGRSVEHDNTLVEPNDSAVMLVPVDDTLGLTWTGAVENEPLLTSPVDGWTPVTASIGFDTAGNTVPTSLLKIDFETNPAATQTDFESLVSTEAGGKTFGDYTVRASGQDVNVSGGFYARNILSDGGVFSNSSLLDDFIFSNVGSPISFVIEGVAPNTPYTITWHVYDRFDSGGGGVYTGQIAPTPGTNTSGDTLATTFDSTVVPASNTQHAYTGTWTSTGSKLEITASYLNGPPNFQVVRVNGFEMSANSSLAELIGTDVESEVAGVASSVYLRIPFQVQTPIDFNKLFLDLHYDDGFVAYLNGVRVAADNVPDPVGFDSLTPVDRPLTNVQDKRRFDLSGYLGLLRPGTNILAIQGLNHAVDGPEFLVRPELSTANETAGRYLSEPTPGAPNSTGFLDFVADTTFDGDPARFHGRGYYSRGFSVVLATATPGATIAYTTDGSEPSPSNGTQVPAVNPTTPPTATVPISETTNLRVMAYRDGFLSTNIDTQTYLFARQIVTQPDIDPEVVNSTLPGYSFFDALQAIPTISITTASENLFGATGIYTNSTAHGRAWERPVSMEFIQPNGANEFQIDAGLRMHGGASRSKGFTSKHGFRFYFRNEYGAGKLDAPVFEGNPVERFDQLVLKGLSTDTWPVVEWAPIQEGFKRWERERASYIRDQWMRDAQLDIAGESADGRFVHVFLNGTYWGMYNLMERATDSFQAAHFGGEKEDYDVIHDLPAEAPGLQAGTTTRWNEMMALAAAGLESEAAYQEIQGNNPDGTPSSRLPNYLNLDSLIDYMILHIFSGGDDWPNHNWWAARRRGSESEGFRFFTWDQEITNNSLDRTRNAWDGGIPYEEVSVFNSPAYLYDRLRRNAAFRIRFGDRVHELLFNGGLLSPESNRLRWKARSSEIDQAIVAESTRWGDTRRSVPYKREVEWLANEAWQDTYWDLNHPKAVQRFRNVNLYPSIDAPSFEVGGQAQHGGAINSGESVRITNSSGNHAIYYTVDGSDPRLPDGSISPMATLYTTPLVVYQSQRIQARNLAAGEWSALSNALFAVDVPLRVTEIMYNPAGADDTEYIELMNVSDSAFPIAGFRLDGAVAGVEFTFDLGEPMLGGGERIVVVRNRSAFIAKYGTNGIRIAIGDYDASGTKLSNDGEQLTLRDSVGAVVQQFTYNDTWYAGTDGGGFALVIRDENGPVADWGNSAAWRTGYQREGAPGVEDLLLSFPGRIQSIERNGAGQLRIEFVGDEGRSYSLERSTNLVDWITVTPFTVAGGNVSLIDSDPPPHNRLFYRVQLLP